MDDKILVNASEAAERLSMSRSFFYSQLSLKRLPQPVRVGKKRLWSVDVLQAWAVSESAKANGGKR